MRYLETKICKGCQVEKPRRGYYLNSMGSLSGLCQECHKIKQREYYHRVYKPRHGIADKKRWLEQWREKRKELENANL